MQLLQNRLIWTFIAQIFAFCYLWTWPCPPENLGLLHVQLVLVYQAWGIHAGGESFRGRNWSLKKSENVLGQGHL